MAKKNNTTNITTITIHSIVEEMVIDKQSQAQTVIDVITEIGDTMKIDTTNVIWIGDRFWFTLYEGIVKMKSIDFVEKNIEIIADDSRSYTYNVCKEFFVKQYREKLEESADKNNQE